MVPPAGEVKAEAGKTGLLVIDVQQRLAPAIPAAPQVLPRIAALLDRAGEIGLPILASEQYSQGLGRTLPELRGRFAADEVIEKIHFAAPREAAFAEALRARRVAAVVVAGMEAHVCVQQTVLALLAAGTPVTVVADAVASRRDLDRRVALARMARAGAATTDTAAVLAAWTAALSPGGR